MFATFHNISTIESEKMAKSKKIMKSCYINDKKTIIQIKSSDED